MVANHILFSVYKLHLRLERINSHVNQDHQFFFIIFFCEIFLYLMLSMIFLLKRKEQPHPRYFFSNYMFIYIFFSLYKICSCFTKLEKDPK